MNLSDALLFSTELTRKQHEETIERIYLRSTDGRFFSHSPDHIQAEGDPFAVDENGFPIIYWREEGESSTLNFNYLQQAEIHKSNQQVLSFGPPSEQSLKAGFEEEQQYTTYRHYLHRAVMLIGPERLSEKINLFKLALKYRPEGYEAWMGLAFTYLGREEKAAEEAFYRYLLYKPASVDNAYSKLAKETLEKAGRAIPAGKDIPLTDHDKIDTIIVNHKDKSIVYQIPNPTDHSLNDIGKRLNQYLLTPDWIKAFFMVEDHPELLSRPATVMIEIELEKLLDTPSYSLAFDRSVALKRSFKQSPLKVFAKKLGYSPVELNSISKGIEAIQPLVVKIINAPTAAEKNQLIKDQLAFFTSNNVHGFLGFFRSRQQSSDIQDVVNEIIWILYGNQFHPLEELLFRTENEQQQKLRKFNTAYNRILIHGAYDQLDELIEGLHGFIKTPELQEHQMLFIETHHTLIRAYELKIDHHNQPSLFPQVMDLFQPIMDMVKKGTRLYVETASLLALILRALSQHNGSTKQEDDAENILLDALNDVPLRTTEYGVMCNQLGIYYRKKAKYGDSEKYLLKARDFMQSAILNEDRQSMSGALYQGNLGNIYNDLYELTGRISYQDQAIGSFESALGILGSDNAQNHVSYNGLGIAFSHRGRIFQSPEFLRRSEDYYQTNLQQEQARAENLNTTKLHAYNNLGLTAIRHYLIRQEVASLNKALQYSKVPYQYAQQQTFFEASIWQQNHAYALLLAYQHSGNQNFLSSSWEILRSIYKQYSTRNVNLYFYDAMANYEVFKLEGKEQFLENTFARIDICLKFIFQHRGYMQLLEPFLFFVDLINQHPSYLPQYQHHIQEAIKGFEYLVKNQSNYEHKKPYIDYYNIFLEKSLPAFVLMGLFEDLLQLLESSIANIFSSRIDFSMLNTITSNSATDDEGIRNLLIIKDGIWNNTRLLDQEELSIQERTKLQKSILDLEKELEETLVKIRALPGQENFGRAITYNDILALSKDHPILYCISGLKGGVLLLLDKGTITSYEVPELKDHTIDDLLDTLYGHSNQLQKKDIDEWAMRSGRWIGQTIFSPIFEKLKHREVYLITIGKVSLLPIQIASLSIDGEEQYVIDQLLLKRVSSVTLLKKLLVLDKQDALSSILFVDNPETVLDQTLEYADMEVGLISRHFDRSSRLSADSATQENLKTKMHHAQILHMACHSFANVDDPLKSGFQLIMEETMTIEDLMNIQHINLRVAILASCQSGLINRNIPSEWVSIPAALAYAGVPSTIASNWLVDDEATCFLMLKFYRLWNHTIAHIPEALQAAQSWLRGVTIDDLVNLLEDQLSEQNEQDTDLTAKIEQKLANYYTRNPNDFPFKSPYYWGAFYYFGQ
ncbi:MAG: CHAT domain-containing protein [Bacteroidota bacterium]